MYVYIKLICLSHLIGPQASRPKALQCITPNCEDLAPPATKSSSFYNITGKQTLVLASYERFSEFGTNLPIDACIHFHLAHFYDDDPKLSVQH